MKNVGSIKITVIAAQEMLDIRQTVFRPQRVVVDCVFDGGEEPKTFHPAGFGCDDLIAIATALCCT